MPTPHDTYEATIATLSSQFMDKLAVAAGEAHTTPDTLLSAVVARLCGEDRRSDGREREWRVRLWLYDCNTAMREPVADSDYPSPYDRPGETVIRGLQNVLTWIAELASNYHKSPCFGLEKHILMRKLNGLRVQMSNRGDGTCTLRAYYTVEGWPDERRMIARCEIQQVTPKQVAIGRLPWSKHRL